MNLSLSTLKWQIQKGIWEISENIKQGKLKYSPDMNPESLLWHLNFTFGLLLFLLNIFEALLYLNLWIKLIGHDLEIHSWCVTLYRPYAWPPSLYVTDTAQ